MSVHLQSRVAPLVRAGLVVGLLMGAAPAGADERAIWRPFSNVWNVNLAPDPASASTGWVAVGTVTLGEGLVYPFRARLDAQLDVVEAVRMTRSGSTQGLVPTTHGDLVWAFTSNDGATRSVLARWGAGGLVWRRAFPVSEPQPRLLLADARDGCVILLGSRVIRLDEDGEVAWSVSASDGAVSGATALADGGIALVGTTGPVDGDGVFLSRLDASGAVMWTVSRWVEGARSHDLVVEAPDGRLITSGSGTGRFILSWSDTGTYLGGAQWNLPSDETVRQLVRGDGEVLVAGEANGPFLLRLAPDFSASGTDLFSGWADDVDVAADGPGWLVVGNKPSTGNADRFARILRVDQAFDPSPACGMRTLGMSLTPSPLSGGVLGSAPTISPDPLPSPAPVTRDEMPFEIEVGPRGADEWEQDDPTRARPLPSSAPAAHDFCDDAEDWHVLELEADQSYAIETSQLGPSADTRLELWSGDLATLLASDDDGGAEPRSSRVVHVPSEGGRHLLRITQADGSAGVDREYVVTLAGEATPLVRWSRAIYGGLRDVRSAIEAGGRILGGNTFVDLRLAHLGLDGRLIASERDLVLLAPTADGGYIAGGVGSTTGAWLVRRDADHVTQWTVDVGGTRSVPVTEMMGTRSGGLVTTSLGRDGAIVTRLSSDGMLTWQRTFDVDPALSAYRAPLVELEDGSVAFAAPIRADGIDRMLVVRLDPTGEMAWSRLVGTGFRWCAGVVSDAAGGVVVVMAPDEPPRSPRAGGSMVVRLAADGSVTWSREVSAGRYLNLYGATRTRDGSIVMAGEAELASGTGDAILVSLSVEGELRWDLAYDAGMQSELFWSVGLDRNGGLLVTGRGPHWEPGWEGWTGWILRLGEDGSGPTGCTQPFPAQITVRDAGLVSSPMPLVDAPSTVVVTPSTRTFVTEALEGRATCTGGAPPWEVTLHVTSPGVLEWGPRSESRSDTFNVYRGDVASLHFGDRGSCLAAGLTSSTHVDPDPPPMGSAWFYFVSGVNRWGEGIVSRDASGAPQAPTVPCP